MAVGCLASTILRCFGWLFCFISFCLMHSQNECAAKRPKRWKMFIYIPERKNVLHFFFVFFFCYSLESRFSSLLFTAFENIGRTHNNRDHFVCFFVCVFLDFISFFRMTSFYLLDRAHNIFLNTSLLKNVFIFVVVVDGFFSQVTFALWWLYVYGCDNVEVFENLNVFRGDAFPKWSAHFIMNCWRSSNGCSWHRNLFHEPWRGGVFVNVWARVKNWSVLERQFETLRSAPIETFGSILL